MAVGSRLDALVGQLDQQTLRSLVLGAVPLVGVWLYLRLVHVPASERAVRFRWTAPAEIRCARTCPLEQSHRVNERALAV